MIVRDLIGEALEEIGVKGADEDIEPEDALKGLKLLRRMYGTFQAKRLFLYAVKRSLFTLIASQQVHTVGNGGNIDIDRPQWISNIGVIPAGDTVEIPLVPYRDRQAFDEERVKSLTDLYPQRYLYEPLTDAFPLGSLTFWPIQTSAPQIALRRPLPLQTLPTDDDTAFGTTLVFPPGYEELWTLGLAKRYCRPFSVAVSDDLRADLMQAEGIVKRLNDEGPPPSRTDPALTGGGGYDMWTNRYR